VAVGRRMAPTRGPDRHRRTLPKHGSDIPLPASLIIAHISVARSLGNPIKQPKGGLDLVQKSRTAHFSLFGPTVEKKMIHGCLHLAPIGPLPLYVVPQFWKDVGNDQAGQRGA